MIKATGDQLVSNLPVELLMKRLARLTIEPNHLESDDRPAAPLLIRRRCSQIRNRQSGIGRLLEVGLVALS